MLKHPGLNIEAILTLADYIESSNKYLQHLCYRCVAGHIFLQQGMNLNHIEEKIKKVDSIQALMNLGISEQQAEMIWHHSPIKGRCATNRDAAAMLRNLAITGQVDWLASER